jgi:hypothetical protein
MNTQNMNTVNPPVILPFAAICSFEAPTTELDPDFVLKNRGIYEKLNRRKSKGHDAQTSQPFKH